MPPQRFLLALLFGFFAGSWSQDSGEIDSGRNTTEDDNSEQSDKEEWSGINRALTVAGEEQITVLKNVIEIKERSIEAMEAKLNELEKRLREKEIVILSNNKKEKTIIEAEYDEALQTCNAVKENLSEENKELIKISETYKSLAYLNSRLLNNLRKQMTLQSSSIEILRSDHAALLSAGQSFLVRSDETDKTEEARLCQCMPEVPALTQVSLTLARQEEGLVTMWSDWDYQGMLSV